MSEDLVIFNISYNVVMGKSGKKKAHKKTGWFKSDLQKFKDGDRLRSYTFSDGSKKASAGLCRVFKWSHMDWDEC